jgi:hypothetical protein
MHDVGAILNITGYDSNWATPHPRTQVELHGGEYRTNKPVMGGTGRFALIDRGPERVVFANLLIRHEGSAFIECGSTPVTDVLHVLNCDWNYGSYGIRIGGYNHGDNSHGYVIDLKVEGCTITGAHSQFKSRYPNNTYIEAMSYEREREVDKRAHEYAKEFERELKWVRSWASEYRL